MSVTPHHLFPTPTHTPPSLKLIHPPGLLISYLPRSKRMPPGLCSQPHIAWLVPRQQESKPRLLHLDKVLHQTPGAGGWTDIGMEEKGSNPQCTGAHRALPGCCESSGLNFVSCSSLQTKKKCIKKINQNLYCQLGFSEEAGLLRS